MTERLVKEFISSASTTDGFRVRVYEESGLSAKLRAILSSRHEEEFHSAVCSFLYEPGILRLKANQRLVEEHVELNPKTGEVLSRPTGGME